MRDAVYRSKNPQLPSSPVRVVSPGFINCKYSGFLCLHTESRNGELFLSIKGIVIPGFFTGFSNSIAESMSSVKKNTVAPSHMCLELRVLPCPGAAIKNGCSVCFLCFMKPNKNVWLYRITIEPYFYCSHLFFVWLFPFFTF